MPLLFLSLFLLLLIITGILLVLSHYKEPEGIVLPIILP